MERSPSFDARIARAKRTFFATSVQLMIKEDPTSWATEFGTANYDCFAAGIGDVAEVLQWRSTNEVAVKAFLAQRRSTSAPGCASLYKRYAEKGQRIFYPSNVLRKKRGSTSAKSGFAKFDDFDFYQRFVAPCYECREAPATWKVLPCQCRCLCRACAFKLKNGGCTRCPVCRKPSRASAKRIDTTLIGASLISESAPPAPVS